MCIGVELSLFGDWLNVPRKGASRYDTAGLSGRLQQPPIRTSGPSRPGLTSPVYRHVDLCPRHHGHRSLRQLRWGIELDTLVATHVAEVDMPDPADAVVGLARERLDVSGSAAETDVVVVLILGQVVVRFSFPGPVIPVLVRRVRSRLRR